LSCELPAGPWYQSVHFAIAGQLAYARSQSTGSFNVAFMDHIHQMKAETIYEYADIQLIRTSA